MVTTTSTCLPASIITTLHHLYILCIHVHIYYNLQLLSIYLCDVDEMFISFSMIISSSSHHEQTGDIHKTLVQTVQTWFDYAVLLLLCSCTFLDHFILSSSSILGYASLCSDEDGRFVDMWNKYYCFVSYLIVNPMNCRKNGMDGWLNAYVLCRHNERMHICIT